MVRRSASILLSGMPCTLGDMLQANPWIQAESSAGTACMYCRSPPRFSGFRAGDPKAPIRIFARGCDPTRSCPRSMRLYATGASAVFLTSYFVRCGCCWGDDVCVGVCVSAVCLYRLGMTSALPLGRNPHTCWEAIPSRYLSTGLALYLVAGMCRCFDGGRGRGG